MTTNPASIALDYETVYNLLNTPPQIGPTGATGERGERGEQGIQGPTGPAAESGGSSGVAVSATYQSIAVNNTSASNNWYNNNAFGYDTMTVNPPGASNNAFGFSALKNATNTSYNSAFGNETLKLNTTGSHNSGFGTVSLYNNTTGYGNVAYGSLTLYPNTDGYYNTAIGMSAGYTSGTSRTNITCVGFSANATGDNQVVLGNSEANTYVNGGSVYSISDSRDKTEIKDTELGLEFIERLRPVDYKWDQRKSYNEIKFEEFIDCSGHHSVKPFLKNYIKNGSKKRNRFHHGFIAQDVKAVMDELNIDFGGYQDHKINGGEDQYTLGYSEFIAPLIKAVQELSNQNKEMRKRVILLEKK